MSVNNPTPVWAVTARWDKGKGDGGLSLTYGSWSRGDMLSPLRDFCKPCFLVRSWYTKMIAIGLTGQSVRLFSPRIENISNVLKVAKEYK